MSRSRGWVLTLNNYSDIEYETIKQYFEEQCDYAIIAKEVGEQGTKHLQMHAEFVNMKSLKQLKELCRRIHAEKRQGSKQQASEYCKKDGNYYEIGKLKDSKGKRSDLDKVRSMVADGKPMGEIIEVCSNYQAIRFAETLKKYKQKGRDWKTEVHWFYGPTGTGKTKTAFEMSKPDNRWISLDSLKWWDGYDGQEDIIIDDFRGSDCRLKTLLRILDRYEYRIEYKGGSTQLLAKRIFITCPYHPKNVYRNLEQSEDIKQLLRRIDHIIKFEPIDYMDKLVNDMDIDLDDSDQLS